MAFYKLVFVCAIVPAKRKENKENIKGEWQQDKLLP